MSVANIYEKMLQNPENLVKRQIRQPTPFDNPKVLEKTENEPEKIEKTEELSEAERNYMADLDKRMAMRAAGKAPVSSSPIQILENRIQEIEKVLKMVMDTHMKLIKKLEKS